MKINHFITLVIGLILIAGSCNRPGLSSQKEAYDDSLKNVLVAHQSLIQSVNEAKLILDSLDCFISSSQPTKESEAKSISTRLQKLSRYVKKSEERIRRVEGALKKSRNEASAHFLMMDALKDEVRIRDEELQTLSDSIARTNTIFSSVSLSKAEKR